MVDENIKIEVPIGEPWMDLSFFEKVMRSYKNDPELEIDNFEVNLGARPGDDTISILYRCQISYKTKDPDQHISLMVKTVPESMVQEVSESNPLFETEMKIYGEILPKIQELWLQAGDTSTLFPKLIYQSNDPCAVIVFEDISEKGFVTVNQPPEDYEDSKIIIQRLAKFHAASFYLANEKNVDFSDYNLCMFEFLPTEALDTIFRETIEIFTDEVKTWSGFEKFVPKLELFAKNYIERARQAYIPNSEKEGGFNVLNHSDHHIKNQMFQKRGGHIKDVRFVDYQLAVYASPAIDLIYSLYSDLSPENRIKHRNDIIMFYHEEFVNALKVYNYSKEPPSLLDLQIELLKCGTLEVLINICLNVFMFIDWTAVTPEDFGGHNGIRHLKKICFQNQEFQKIIKTELPRLFYMGII